MTITLTSHESQLLAALLEAAHRERLHELHHTSTAAFRQRLREELGVIERLIQRVATTSPA
jgi:hypothetical protein